jgi:ABC-type phosphate transport system substrate-binding protein
MKTNQLAAVAAAVLGLAGAASNAEAVDIFASGSSAGRQFINEVPLSVCDHTAGTITHYQSSNNNTHLWKCKFNGQDVNFHYSARGSSDGPYPTDDLSGGDRSKGKYNGKGYLGYIDVANPATSGCGTPASTNKTFYDVDTATSVTISILENKTCTNPPSTVTTDYPEPTFVRRSTDFGFSDVQFTSFGQSSPAGTEPADPAPNITEHKLMVLPFSIVVQNSVRRVDANGNNIGPVLNLTQTEIEQIFSRSARDWRELGYAVTNDLAGTQAVPSGPHTIRLCMREFGSGSKATFDQVLMKEEAEEWNGAVANTTFYFASSSGVRDCMNDVQGPGQYGKIGYIDAFESSASPAYVTPAVANPMPNAHPVSINGFRGVDVTVADTNKATARPQVLRGVRCGKSEFWVNLEGYSKTAGTGDATKDAFITRFMSDAADKNVIENLPANWAFEATQNILATKTEDRIAPDHASYTSRQAEYDSQCRGFYASPNP